MEKAKSRIPSGTYSGKNPKSQKEHPMQFTNPVRDLEIQGAMTSPCPRILIAAQFAGFAGPNSRLRPFGHAWRCTCTGLPECRSQRVPERIYSALVRAVRAALTFESRTIYSYQDKHADTVS